MDVQILLISFFIVVGFSFYLGMKVSKGKKGDQTYYLADRTLGGIALGFSVMATQVGGGLVLGTADSSYESGWSVYLWPLGNALGLIIIALGLGQRLRRLKIGTVAELFEKVYSWVYLRKFAAWLSVLSLFLILMAQIVAAKRLLLCFGVESTTLFIGMWVLVMLYTVIGGLKAVVYTDIIQAIVILALLGVGTFVLLSFSAPDVSINPVMEFTETKGMMLNFFLMPLLFMIIGQDMGQRCFSAKNDKAVRTAFIIGGLGVALTGMMPVAVGLYAKYLGLEFAPGTSVLMGTFQKISPPFITGLVGCAVLVALISTVDSLLCALSSNIAFDFSEKKLFKGAPQWITFVAGMGAVIFSLYFQNISPFLMVSYELSCVCLAIPILLGLFVKKGKPLAAMLSMLGGGLGFILFRIYPNVPVREILALSISALGYGVGTMISREKVKLEKTLNPR